MFKISRKVIIVSAMVVLLVITGIINWKFIAGKGEEEAAAEKGAVETANFFTTYKSERAANRSDEITYLDSVIANANTDTATLNEAQQMKMEIVANMESETALEGLLVSKGFADAIVTMGTTSVNVVVKDAELTQAKVAQILDIVTTQTEYSPGDVKIIQAQ